MTVNLSLLVPWSYGRQRKTLADVQTHLLEHHHPEYVRRLVAWLSSKGGQIGVGGGWRATQPDRPGFAPDGMSFHQDQRYSDGFVGACAVDLVALNGLKAHRAPYWSEVPEQYSAESLRWGVHCNLEQGSAVPESWHMQPVEIDGWASWKRNGSPAPVAGYPLPTDPPPTPDPVPTPPALTSARSDMEFLNMMCIAKTTDGPHVASTGFGAGTLTVGENGHDITTEAVFAAGAGRALDVGSRPMRVVSWTPTNPGSWKGVTARLTKAQAIELLGPEI